MCPKPPQLRKRFTHREFGWKSYPVLALSFQTKIDLIVPVNFGTITRPGCKILVLCESKMVRILWLSDNWNLVRYAWSSLLASREGIVNATTFFMKVECTGLAWKNEYRILEYYYHFLGDNRLIILDLPPKDRWNSRRISPWWTRKVCSREGRTEDKTLMNKVAGTNKCEKLRTEFY